ncbi:MAG: nucleoside 2-deoxyribosyltransferase domain-containing protein [Parabacteroides sp.]
MEKVFLGGTCNDSSWRDKLIPLLKIDYFNPVVDDWTEECQQEEIRQKNICRYHLYVITPRMTGCFSIAEVVDSSNKNPLGTIFCVLESDGSSQFNSGEMKSLNAVKNMVKNNGAKVFESLDEIAEYFRNKTNDLE